MRSLMVFITMVRKERGYYIKKEKHHTSTRNCLLNFKIDFHIIHLEFTFVDFLLVIASTSNWSTSELGTCSPLDINW